MDHPEPNCEEARGGALTHVLQLGSVTETTTNPSAKGAVFPLADPLSVNRYPAAGAIGDPRLPFLYRRTLLT